MFSGSEAEFNRLIKPLHDTGCGLPFAQWKDTNWQVCQNGHTYWTDGVRWWCRPTMARDDPIDWYTWAKLRG